MKDYHILIADDEPLTRKSLHEILKFEGYKISLALDGEEAFKIAEQTRPDIIIADLKMPKMDGMTLLKKVKSLSPDIAVILITAYGSIENAVETMKEGAFEYITKPIIDSEIKIIIQRICEQQCILEENRSLREKLAHTSRNKFHEIVGQNSEMQRIYALIETVAITNATVLIQGESGTGKGLIARALHYSDSYRKDKPFIEVSCGALPETLLESELFGHIKGSFTSAIRDRTGRFEAANEGTIFLDEIDAFSFKLQVKLLKVLQEGKFEKVGDSETIRTDTRIIAATNQNLKELIEKGLFREDLYYRLNVIPINVPPLRERKDDIPFLVEYLLKKSLQKIKGKKVKGVSKEAMEMFLAYSWPGNIRELENIIERAVILCKSDTFEKEDLPELFQNVKTPQVSSIQRKKMSLKEALRDSEKEIVGSVLRACKGNRKKAAEFLGINRTTLYNKMKDHKFL